MENMLQTLCKLVFALSLFASFVAAGGPGEGGQGGNPPGCAIP